MCEKNFEEKYSKWLDTDIFPNLEELEMNFNNKVKTEPYTICRSTDCIVFLHN